MTDPRKIAEDIEAGGGATVEQRRTLARAYLELVSDLTHATGACGCNRSHRTSGHVLNGRYESWQVDVWPAEHEAAIDRLRALGGG